MTNRRQFMKLLALAPLARLAKPKPETVEVVTVETKRPFMPRETWSEVCKKLETVTNACKARGIKKPYLLWLHEFQYNQAPDIFDQFAKNHNARIIINPKMSRIRS